MNSTTFAGMRAVLSDPTILSKVSARRPDWAVGLTAGSGTTPVSTLAQVAAGSNDADFTYIAQQMAVLQPTQDIRMRLGWEFNGPYFPWYSVGNETNYINAFRHVVGLFRAVSTRFKFVWCANYSVGDGMGGFVNSELSYPGDAYVDIVGLDAYYEVAYDGSDPSAAFGYKKTAPYGFGWQVQFARQHQKGLCFSEWGMDQNGQSLYVSLMNEWMRTQGYLYHNYWDSTDVKTCQLSAGAYPTTGAAFVAAFKSPLQV